MPTPPASTSPRDPLLDTQIFLGRYRVPILFGLLAAVVLLAAYGGYRIYRDRQDAAAATMLAEAKQPQDFQQVIAQYPGTAAASSAELMLAADQRKEQKFAEANTTLQEFIKQHPKHEFVATAKMAIAGNLESLGKPDEALEMYRRVAAESPNNYNAPMALLAEVHLLKAKGQIEEARRVCETVLTQYRESYAAQEATEYLRILKPAAPVASAAPSPAASASAPAVATPAAVPAASVSPAASTAPTP